VALREIADESISSDDLHEDFIHSMQKLVEVDEPEADAAPILAPDPRVPTLARDDKTSDTQIDRMSEEELLRGLESLVPIEASNAAATRNR
jgi:DNA-directed RNA polymerase subunit omega